MSSPHNPDEALPLFVFGTLRRGEENHRVLEGHYARMLSAVAQDFRRTVAPHGFPAMVSSPGDGVAGELYFFRAETYKATLARCDELEDIPPGETVGEFYRRARIVVETTEGPQLAWAYIDPRTQARAPRR